jgi:hypothetical protein
VTRRPPWRSPRPPTKTTTTSSSRVAAFFGDRFELGERLEILGAAGRTLDEDQLLEREAAVLDAKSRQRDRLADQTLVCSATGDLADQIDIATGRGEREVEAVRQGLGIPGERQAATNRVRLSRVLAYTTSTS